MTATTYRSADKTRDKIIKAARALFIEQGFAATAMAKIAEKAKVNHSLLFHHFGNKSKLWLAVKMDIVEKANQTMEMLPDTDRPFAQFLKQLMNNSIRFYQSSPDLLRLFQWQRLEKSKGTRLNLKFSDEAKRWLQALNYYQKKGEIRSTIKTEFLMTQIFSLASTAALDPIFFIEKPEDLNQYINFCVKSMLEATSP